MALIAWLKREGFGAYNTVDDFTGELGRRSTSALGALGAALVAKPEDLVEAARGDGHGICADVVGDLRVAKGARLAALRAVLMAGAGSQLAKIFVGAFDLAGDARLPEADRAYLVKGGLKAFLDATAPMAVTLDVLRAAASAEAGLKALGKEVVQEVLAAYPTSHTPALTIRHAALGDGLPPDLEQRWLDVLSRQYRAAKNAPPAARRLGTAPTWPPVVPDAFVALVKKAEASVATSAPAPGPVLRPPAPATPAPGDAPAPAPAKEMPALRPRARGAVNEESYLADDVQVTAASMRTAPSSPAAETSSKASPVPSFATTPREPALKQVRFGEQVELVASRGTRALERLVATFDVRCGLVGREKALGELSGASRRRGSQEVNQPILDELFAFASDLKTPPSWRLAARAVLEHLSPDRFAALPPEAMPREPRYARPSV